MIILGIDPGTAIMGYGLIEQKGNRLRALNYSCWRTSAHTPLAERLLILYNQICPFLREHHPDHIAVEELFFNRNTTTAISVGQARGIILLAGAQQSIPIYEYTPLQVKQSVVGYGRAEKQQVQQMVKGLLGLDKIPKPDDTADALAIAICHAHSFALERRMEDFR
ncbi:Holliday junction endonuclease RuvC [Desulfosporosinus acidiphilus SJ4]|uniref:Crossover junction endodeoxyribonuclease RuvC n=1 Tax=Desulfosporosinus acidiphilus (strain DSM 22704 / JCM 16185 / SJ4) TaxID=646529 RepID=I4D9A3_DESAJ|nr:crossover junction endodeoxyribonuclease RuvC [Desulfosporosinus acidiphilus]AFM42377.1 Holliday junction endonuclease RuvC [Desulfosporosinus acidiphilus SJ4]